MDIKDELALIGLQLFKNNSWQYGIGNNILFLYYMEEFQEWCCSIEEIDCSKQNVMECLESALKMYLEKIGQEIEYLKSNIDICKYFLNAPNITVKSAYNGELARLNESMEKLYEKREESETLFMKVICH